jgi:hypothetical protein
LNTIEYLLEHYAGAQLYRQGPKTQIWLKKIIGGAFHNLEQDSSNAYYLITFPSVHHAMAFEDMAKSGPLIFQLIPVPREISSSCGVAAKVQHITKEELLQLLRDYKLSFSAVYFYADDGCSEPQRVL